MCVTWFADTQFSCPEMIPGGRQEDRERGGDEGNDQRLALWNGCNTTYSTNTYNSFLPYLAGAPHMNETADSRTIFHAVSPYDMYLTLSERSHLCVWHLNNTLGELLSVQKEKKQQYCPLVREEFVTWSFGNGVCTLSLFKKLRMKMLKKEKVANKT